MSHYLHILVPFMMAILTAAPLSGEPPAPTALPVETTWVTDRVLIARGPIGTNVTAIATHRGIVIVDTHLSPASMETIQAEIARELDRSDFTHVVNTHGHWDHCSGNQAFTDAAILGHANSPVFMQHHLANSPGTIWFQRTRLESDRRKLEEASPQETQTIRVRIASREGVISSLQNEYTATPPTVAFDDRYELDMGDVTVQLISCGDAHTITDIFVYVPEERVVMTGDVFCSPSSFCFKITPLIDVQRLFDAIDFVLEGGVDVVIPGHGDIMTGEDLHALRGRLADAYDGIAGDRSAGQRLEKMLVEGETDTAMQSFIELATDTDRVGYLSEDEFHIVGGRMIDRGRVDAAMAVFELSLELFPESALICNGLARSYWAGGDTRSAIATFERAYELDADNRYAQAMVELLQEDTEEGHK